MTPVEELRAAAASLHAKAAAACAATLTGKGAEWRPWGVIHDMRLDPSKPPVVWNDLPFGPMEMPVYERTGQATVVHDRYAHNGEEDWYETVDITGRVATPVAEWIAAVHPGLAEPLADLLEYLAGMIMYDAQRGYDNTAKVQYVTAVTRVINGGAS